MNLGHRIPIVVWLSVVVCSAVAGPALAHGQSAAAASPSGSAGSAGAVSHPNAATIDLAPNGAVDAIGIYSTGVIVGGAFIFAGHIHGADHLARFKGGRWFEVD